jgi:hypothetical protein
MYNVKPVDDDVAWQDLDATVLEPRQIGFCKETDRSPLGFVYDGADGWRGYVNRLQQEPVRADLRDLDVKIFFRCRQYFNVSCQERRLTRQRICKCKNSTPRHFQPPPRQKIRGYNTRRHGISSSDGNSLTGTCPEQDAVQPGVS